MACMKINCSVFHIRLLLLLASLILTTLKATHFMAQGKPYILPSSTQFTRFSVSRNQERGMEMRSAIGSRPPRCDERCRSCGHCEAIQVPVTNLKASMYANSRGDDITNYKPMCWKCKCGDFIFSP